MPASPYLQARIMGLLSPCWIGLHESDPALGGSEVVGRDYARQAVLLADPSGDDPLTTTSTNLIVFQAGADWGEVGWWSLWDASSMVYSGELEEPRDMTSGSVLRLPPGTITVRVAS